MLHGCDGSQGLSIEQLLQGVWRKTFKNFQCSNIILNYSNSYFLVDSVVSESDEKFPVKYSSVVSDV